MATNCSEDLKTFVLGDTNVKRKTGRMSQGFVPPGAPLPYIFLALSDHASEVAMDDAAGLDPFTRTYDVECWGQSIGEAEQLEEYVTNRLNCHRGAFGGGTVQGVFVTGQPQDYIPKGVNGGTGFHGANLLVEIKGYVPG